jgi:hypothetical protein
VSIDGLVYRRTHIFDVEDIVMCELVDGSCKVLRVAGDEYANAV